VKVFGGRILSRGDSKGASGHIQIANTWLIVNVGGGPTPDKPSVTLSVPADPDQTSGFVNIRVADIRACYELWKSRGAEFITEPKEKYEIRCYIRDPDLKRLKGHEASDTALPAHISPELYARSSGLEVRWHRRRVPLFRSVSRNAE